MSLDTLHDKFNMLNYFILILYHVDTRQARREPTVPSVTVRALRTDWPADRRSPFFNPDGAMRPFARLRLNRLRLYEKSCDAGDHIHSNEY